MIVKYSAKWLPYLREISDNSFTYPTIRWQNLSEYSVKMHFAEDPVLNVAAKPTGFYVIKPVEKGVLLLKLCVHPMYKNLGHGSDLLHNIEKYVLDTGGTFVSTNVHEMNLCTIYWLQKRGYNAMRIEIGLYSDNRDGYSFYKEIK
jgi:GNAT superfamily N-acetyltransferase